MERDRDSYVRRVSKYLQDYQSNKVDSFKIHCKPMSTTSRDECIRFAITKGVEELHVRVGLSCWSRKASDKVFPRSLLVGSTSNHLKRLSLEECILAHPTPALDVFNRLTNLCLKEITVYESVMENLFSVCVFLESLTLNKCQTSHNGCYLLEEGCIVAGDRLTHLKVKDSIQGTVMDISAPNLASLEYHAHWNKGFSIKTPRLSRIVSSYKKCEKTLHHALIEFASCLKLETLHLQMPVGEICRSSNKPTYGNLRQLRLDIDLYQQLKQNPYRQGTPPRPRVCYVLQDLLKAAPLLEELTIRTQNQLRLDMSETDPEATRYDHSAFKNDQLRIVKMQGFRGHWYEIELAICILEDSPKLEKLVIHQHLEQEQPREVVEEKLMGVETDAQILFL